MSFGMGFGTTAMPTAQLTLTQDTVVLSNKYVRAVFDLQHPSLSSLSGDYYGTGDFSTEALAKWGCRLESEGGDGKTHASSDITPSTPLEVTVHSNTTALVNVSVGGIVDRQDRPVSRERWTLSLAADDRALDLSIEGEIARAATVRAVRHGCYMQSTSVNGLFARGVVQMKDGKGGNDFFGTRDAVERVFALGGGSALDTTLTASLNVTTLLLSSASGSPYWSGVQRAMFADYGDLGKWDGGWQGKPTVAVAAGAAYRAGMVLAPNNRNLPALALAGGADGLAGDDLEAMLTGIYGSAVGPLCTFDNGVVDGQRLAQAILSSHQS